MWRVKQWHQPQFIIFYLSGQTGISTWRLKIPDFVPLSVILMFSAQRHGENSIVLKAMESQREREQPWYTKTISRENQPWQHYCFSVEWRYPASCVTLLYFIIAHTVLLNPITADQCCLFHSSREMICLKVIFSQQILGPKLAQLSIEGFYTESGRWPIMTTSNRGLHCLIINI